jgi:hypothetical protein
MIREVIDRIDSNRYAQKKDLLNAILVAVDNTISIRRAIARWLAVVDHT